MRRGRNRG